MVARSAARAMVETENKNEWVIWRMRVGGISTGIYGGSRGTAVHSAAPHMQEAAQPTQFWSPCSALRLWFCLSAVSAGRTNRHLKRQLVVSLGARHLWRARLWCACCAAQHSTAKPSLSPRSPRLHDTHGSDFRA